MTRFAVWFNHLFNCVMRRFGQEWLGKDESFCTLFFVVRLGSLKNFHMKKDIAISL